MTTFDKFARIMDDVGRDRAEYEQRQAALTRAHFAQHPECLPPIVGEDWRGVRRDKTRVIDVDARCKPDWFARLDLAHEWDDRYGWRVDGGISVAVGWRKGIYQDLLDALDVDKLRTNAVRIDGEYKAESRLYLQSLNARKLAAAQPTMGMRITLFN